MRAIQFMIAIVLLCCVSLAAAGFKRPSGWNSNKSFNKQNRFSSRSFLEDQGQKSSSQLTPEQRYALGAQGYNLPGCGQRSWARSSPYLQQQQQQQQKMLSSVNGRSRRIKRDNYEIFFAESTPDSVSDATEDPYFKPRPTIINGEIAQEGQFPWQVSLQHNGKHVCGACIIDKCHVATAAHCVSDSNGQLTEDSKNFVVVYGSIDNKRGYTTTVDKRMKHAYFTNIPYDTALLKVSTCFDLENDPNVKAACMPDEDRLSRFREDDHATVSGWGVINESTGKTSNMLHYVNLKMIPGETCKEQLDSEFFDEQTMLCQEKSKTGCCFGDSGGPMVWYDNEKDGAAVLMGEVSWLLGHCGDGKNPSTVFTSVPAYREWIERACLASPCDQC